MENELINNEARHNFEWFINGHRAFIDYRKEGDTVRLVHTEVPKELEGKGIAAQLVEKVFQYIEEHKLRIVPECSYVQHYLQRHPEWHRLVVD